MRDLSCWLSSISLHAFAVALVTTAAVFETPDFAVTSGGVSITGSRATVAIDTQVEFSETPAIDLEATSPANPFHVKPNDLAAAASHRKPSQPKVDSPSATPRPFAATLPRAVVEPLLIPHDGLLDRIGEDASQQVSVRSAEVNRPKAASQPADVKSDTEPESHESEATRAPKPPEGKKPREVSAKKKPTISQKTVSKDVEPVEPARDSEAPSPPREKPETLKDQGKNSTTAPSSNEPAGAKVDQLPRKLATNASPAYPLDAWQKQQQGVVYLIVRVSTAGQASSVKIYRSSGFKSLDEAARKTVQGWKFQPAMRAGKPMASPVVVPVRFRIQQSSQRSSVR